MLGKPKKPENEVPFAAEKKTEAEKSAPATPPPVPPRPAVQASEEKTIIGQHITIEGQIRGEEHLVIEGSMKGNVQMEKHNFKVGANGRVDGEVRAQRAATAKECRRPPHTTRFTSKPRPMWQPRERKSRYRWRTPPYVSKRAMAVCTCSCHPWNISNTTWISSPPSRPRRRNWDCR